MSTAGTKATKLTLVFINFLFVALGLSGMVAGGWVLIYREDIRVLTMLDVATNQFGLLQNAAILLLTSGLALFVLGFVGCCAVYKGQRCLQVVYIGLVTMCCIVTICSCAVAFLFRDQMEEDLLDHLLDRLRTDYQGFSTSDSDFSRALDWAHVEFQCCGVRSKDDFKQAMNWTVKNSSQVPVSCCRQQDRDAFLEDNFYTIVDRNCAQFPNSTNSYIDTPCYQKLKDWMEEEVLVMGAIAIVAIILQLLAILFIIALMRQRPKNTDNLYRAHGSSY